MRKEKGKQTCALGKKKEIRALFSYVKEIKTPVNKVRLTKLFPEHRTQIKKKKSNYFHLIFNNHMITIKYPHTLV